MVIISNSDLHTCKSKSILSIEHMLWFGILLNVDKGTVIIEILFVSRSGEVVRI